MIGSGLPGQSALDQAKVILSMVHGDLHRLAKLNIADLRKVKGIGQARAMNILCAMELSRRRLAMRPTQRRRILHADDIYDLMVADLMDLDVEHFWVLFLNRSQHLIAKERISIGGISSTLVDPKVIFKSAMRHTASALALVHNHPSGTLKPSTQDVLVTRKIHEGAALLDITLMDHLIFTDHGFFSFADKGIL